MADEEYDVEARITVRHLGAMRAVDQVTKRTERLERTATRAGTGLTRSFVAVAGFASAYIGVRSIAHSFASIARSSFDFASAMSVTETSLGAIIAATQPAISQIPDATERLNRAGEVGRAIFRSLQTDAIKSVATTRTLASIYSGIAGPLIGAGATLGKVRKITRDTVAAATALGVDFAQAQRDIMMMSSGAAGMEVKLFRMLRSVGLITESTREWNELLPEKRLARMEAALGTFGPSAERFATTLPGATSTFTDLVEIFRGTFAGPTIALFTKTLMNVNNTMIENKDRIMAFLTTAGAVTARVFSGLFNKIDSLTSYFVTNMEFAVDSLGSRIQSIENILRTAQRLVPAIGGQTTEAAQSRTLQSTALTVTGAAIGAKMASPVLGAGLKAAFAPITELAIVISRVVGIVPALTIAFALLTAIIGPLIDSWSSFWPVLQIVGEIIADVIGVVFGLIGAVGSFLIPLLKFLGTVFMIVFTPFAAIFIGIGVAIWAVIKVIVRGWSLIFGLLGRAINDYLYEPFLKALQGIFSFIAKAARAIGVSMDVLAPEAATPEKGMFDDFLLNMRKTWGELSAQMASDEDLIKQIDKDAPTARKTVVNDFRGSKIEVKQDFRDADPDRVWIQMMDAVNNAAEQRIASALAPDFTR